MLLELVAINRTARTKWFGPCVSLRAKPEHRCMNGLVTLDTVEKIIAEYNLIWLKYIDFSPPCPP